MNYLKKYELSEVADFEIRELLITQDVLSLLSKNKNTLRTIKSTAKNFNKFLSSNNFVFSQFALEQYIEQLLERNIKKSSIDVILRRIKKITKCQEHVRKNGLIKMAVDGIFKSIFETKFKAKVDKKISANKYLTENEIERMLSIANEKEKLMIKFLVSTGLRICEMINCKLCDLELFSNNVYSYTFFGKGDKQRTVYFTRELASQIIGTFNSKVYLFETKKHTKFMNNSVYRTMRNLAIKAGITKIVGCHIFRHSFATLALKSGKSLKWVSQVLGHSTTSITADMYIHEDTSDMHTVFNF